MTAAPTTSGSVDPEENTVDLLRAARAGDQNAWERLDRRYRNILTLTMRGNIGGSDRARFDTEDLLQSAFLSAYRDLDTFEYRGKGSFLRWLTGVMYNRLKAKLRAERAQRRDVAREDPLGTVAEEALTASGPGPAALVAQAERAAHLVEALADLPDEERLAVQWVVIDGRTITYAADQLETSPSTIRRRVAAGVRTLERSLGERDVES